MEKREPGREGIPTQPLKHTQARSGAFSDMLYCLMGQKVSKLRILKCALPWQESREFISNYNQRNAINMKHA